MTKSSRRLDYFPKPKLLRDMTPDELAAWRKAKAAWFAEGYYRERSKRERREMIEAFKSGHSHDLMPSPGNA